MLHKLFTIKAHDKAYILHTSDSIIMQIVEYYEKIATNICQKPTTTQEGYTVT